MASFLENIRKIRGEAIYGMDMRAAIAEALEQSVDLDISGDGFVVFTLTEVDPQNEDFLLDIRNQ